MLKKSYILNFIIDAKFNIWNKIFVISVLGLGGVVFDSVCLKLGAEMFSLPRGAK